ncbi:MAG: RNHCP domain-containing protein [Clostridiales bacterium]|nr:RNHCP domain-containing protein [Clostridiales bacterium]
MNRENRKKSFDKDYYKDNPCDETFVCRVCGRTVVPEGAGSGHRNHCPNCLCSRHLDIEPGDRASDCGGMMEPIAVWVRKNGEWAIVHRCRVCGALSSNRVAADDNPMKLMSIAMKPLSSPPFPLERIEEMTRLMGGDGELRP